MVRMCAAAGFSRAGYCRFLEPEKPCPLDMDLRDMQQTARDASAAKLPIGVCSRPFPNASSERREETGYCSGVGAWELKQTLPRYLSTRVSSLKSAIPKVVI